MRSHPLAIRQRLYVAAGLGAFVLTCAVVPTTARAAEGCQAAAAPNGKVFGKRFGKLLGAAGMAAITGRKAAARAAADAAGRDVVDSARENAAASAASAGCNAASGSDDDSGAASDGERSEKTAQVSYKRPSQIPVAADVKARKEAFDDFGKVSCSSCEGGYSYESWAHQYFYSEIGSERNGWANKLAKMEPGERINWQGSENFGTITMRSAERIGGFDCKTYTWRLEKDSANAERDGLVCFGKASEYSANDSWVEVY